MRYVKDLTGRFKQRPHYEPSELDDECEGIVTAFMRNAYGGLTFPIPTDALTKLIERDAADLDLFASVSDEGDDVEGVTLFIPGSKPRVRIAEALSIDARRAHRLRTTLTHEYGHVKLHAYLFDVEEPSRLLENTVEERSAKCLRQRILDAAPADWMEWQAGYMCGALLMPVTHVKRLCHDFLTSQNFFSPLEVDSTPALDLRRTMAQRFDVSDDAARVRLLKLRLLTQDAVPASLFNQ
jgi:hypothetical protein